MVATPRFVDVRRFPIGGPATAATLSEDGSLLAVALAPAATGPKVRVYECATGRVVQAWGERAEWAKGVVFAETNGYVWAALALPDSRVHLARRALSTDDQKLVHEYGAGSNVFGLVAGPFGSQVGVYADYLDLWSAGPTLVVHHEEPSTPSRRIAAAIVPGGAVWLSGVVPDAIICRDTTTGQELHHLTWDCPDVGTLTPSPDGRFLLARSDGLFGMRLWDLTSGQVLHPKTFGDESRTAAWSFRNDGEWLVVAPMKYFAFQTSDLTMLEGPTSGRTTQLASARAAPVLAAVGDGEATVVRLE